MSHYRTIGERHKVEGLPPRTEVETEGGVMRPACRWCGKACMGRRSTFCSGTAAKVSRDGYIKTPGSGCVHEWLIRADLSYARRLVLARDGGVCALCLTDTYALHQAARVMDRASRGWYDGPEPKDSIIFGAFAALGYTRKDFDRMTWWDMDHVIPVEEGGGECGLDGLRTLCIPCHRKVTAEQARRRAAAA